MDRAEMLTEEDLAFFTNLTKHVSPGRGQPTGRKTRRSRSRKAMGTSFTRPFSGPTKPAAPAATIQPESANVIARLTECSKPAGPSPAAPTAAAPWAQTQHSAQADQTVQPAETAGPGNRLAGRYDVRNISSRGMNRLGQELYQAGRIGREELAMLSFQPELSANYDRVGAEGIQRPDPDGTRDALQEWRAILARQLEFGHSSYFTDKTQSIIRLLESLDRSGRGAA
jgi:hypothetical protein